MGVGLFFHYIRTSDADDALPRCANDLCQDLLHKDGYIIPHTHKPNGTVIYWTTPDGWEECLSPIT